MEVDELFEVLLFEVPLFEVLLGPLVPLLFEVLLGLLEPQALSARARAPTAAPAVIQRDLRRMLRGARTPLSGSGCPS